MKFRKFFKQLLSDASIYFTLLTAAYALGMIIANVKEETVLLPARWLVFFFLFSILAALARSIPRLSNMGSAPRLLLPFVILTVAFYLCFLLPFGMRAAQVFIGIVLFTIVYWICAGLYHVFSSRFRKHRERTQDYENQFSKKR